MDRRDFIRFSSLASAGLAFPGTISSAFAEAAPGDNWKLFEVTTRVEILKPEGVTRVWVPTPLSWDTAYQKGLGNSFKAEAGTSGIATDWTSGTRLVWAEWP